MIKETAIHVMDEEQNTDIYQSGILIIIVSLLQYELEREWLNNHGTEY